MLPYGRGRPRGPLHSLANVTNCAYLIGISKKYGIDTRKFLVCFLDAWTHENSSYKSMLIKCRQKTEDDGVFLVMQDQKVIAQLRLDDKLLGYLSEVDLSSFRFEESTPARKSGALKAIDLQIKDLTVETKLVNLKATVIEKSTTGMVFSRFGDALLISNAIISDDTGSTKLTLWNNQIKAISVGDAVQIENGRVTTFRGELHVSIGRHGTLNVIENQST
jgi:replication factor A1